METDSCRLQAGGIGLTCWHAACRYWRLCVGRALIPSFHSQESPHGPHRWPAAAWALSVSSRCTMYGHIYIRVNKHTHLHCIYTHSYAIANTHTQDAIVNAGGEWTHNCITAKIWSGIQHMCVWSTYVHSDSLFNRSPAWLRDRTAFLQNALWLQGKELSIPNKMHMCDWSDSFVNCSRKEIGKENRAWRNIGKQSSRRMGGCMCMTFVRHLQRSYEAFIWHSMRPLSPGRPQVSANRFLSISGLF